MITGRDGETLLRGRQAIELWWSRRSFIYLDMFVGLVTVEKNALSLITASCRIPKIRADSIFRDVWTPESPEW